MRALRYRASPAMFLLAGTLGKRAPIGLAPLRLERVERPTPAPGWRSVDVRLAGVCGSDLALLFGKSSPRLSPFFSFPAVLGHEILGEAEGSRVVVNPVVACAELGREQCGPCERGDDNHCANVAEGPLAPGLIGYNRDLPGGWGETLVAREARVHAVPDSVPDERAVLAEPFAVGWRAARIACLHGASARLLVIGSGTIGLATIAALRHVGFSGEVHAVARYADQGERATAMGADRVHADTAAAGASVGARSYRATIGPPAWRGGFDIVIDAAGSRSSLDAALWAAREGGTVVLVGGPGTLRHDFSPHWFREVSLVGSYIYTAADFAAAVAALPRVSALDHVALRRSTLEDFRTAIADQRARRGAKVVFEAHP